MVTPPAGGDRAAAARRARGHRVLPHTADLAIEAWAPSRAECLTEAVRALVGSFLDVSDAREPEGRAGGEANEGPAVGATAGDEVTVRFAPDRDEDLLVAVLEEVIYLLEVHERVPVDADVDEDEEGGLTVSFATAATDAVALVGAVPKAVARHELRFGPSEGGGWRCHVTVDV